MDPRLLEWSRLPGPAKVLAAARRRLEAGRGMGGSPLRVALSPGERDEVGRLLGAKWALSGRAVSAKALTSAIASLGTDLVTLLTSLDGPVRDRPAEREAASRNATGERLQAHTELTAVGVPADLASAWTESRGTPAAGDGRLSGLAAQCASVWRALPTGGATVLLTVLAAAALGDPHALDRGSPVAAGVLRLLHGELPGSAETWRAAWEDRGVVVDPLSSRVLVLNVELRGDAAACRLTSAAADEPLWLTWRSLTGSFRATAPEVYVCENPSILAAAADQLGVRSRPLVCTNGRPSAATRRLLLGLAGGGVVLHVRADDDAAGQSIVAELRTLIPGVRLWAYELRTPSSPRYEEQDLHSLLEDLSA